MSIVERSAVSVGLPVPTSVVLMLTSVGRLALHEGPPATDPSRPSSPGSGPWSLPRGASPSVQQREEIGAAVVGSGRLQPGREPVDRDVARTQSVGEIGRDGLAAGDVDDGAAVTEPA